MNLMDILRGPLRCSWCNKRVGRWTEIADMVASSVDEPKRYIQYPICIKCNREQSTVMRKDITQEQLHESRMLGKAITVTCTPAEAKYAPDPDARIRVWPEWTRTIRFMLFVSSPLAIWVIMYIILVSQTTSAFQIPRHLY